MLLASVPSVPQVLRCRLYLTPRVGHLSAARTHREMQKGWSHAGSLPPDSCRPGIHLFHNICWQGREKGNEYVPNERQAVSESGCAGAVNDVCSAHGTKHGRQQIRAAGATSLGAGNTHAGDQAASCMHFCIWAVCATVCDSTSVNAAPRLHKSYTSGQE